MKMNKPEECTCIGDIRSEIDRIDRHIIDLLGERLLFVREIVKYKSNEEEVKAKDRYKEVLKVRKEWAKEKDLDPEVIAEVYKTIIASFINEQLKLLKDK
jgi:isochorismate pyruvate lyase